MKPDAKNRLKKFLKKPFGKITVGYGIKFSLKLKAEMSNFNLFY